MDISSLIEYEQSFPVHLKYPFPHEKAGEDTGIVFHIVSFDSERVVKAVKAVDGERIKMMFESADKVITPEQYAELELKYEKVRASAAVVGWDWNGSEWADLGTDPVFSKENVDKVINHRNAIWIRSQIIEAGVNIGNFFPESVPPSQKPSKRK